MSRSTKWVFTLNNPTQDEISSIHAFAETAHCQYLIYGNEVGAEGTPHLQGYVKFTLPQRLSYLRNKISDRGHYELARGSPQQASDYCKKEGDFHEFGTLPLGQGKRSDIDRFKNWVSEQTSRPSERSIAREFPGLFLRYPRLTSLLEHLLPQPDIQSGEFRPWQSVLDTTLQEPPNDRQVEFIVDPEGAQGKSWFVRYYISKYPDQVQFLSVGKRDDLAFAIDESKSIFLFDVPRGQLEFFQYSDQTGRFPYQSSRGT